MIQFVEVNDPVSRKKFYKLDQLGPVCRILQPVILQTTKFILINIFISVIGVSDISQYFDDISSTQLALPAEMGGLGVPSASLLALPAFLVSAFGASDFLTMIFSEKFEDVSFTKALEKWLSLTNEQKSRLDGTQKNWTQPVFVKTGQELTSRMDDKVRKFSTLIKVNSGLNG